MALRKKDFQPEPEEACIYCGKYAGKNPRCPDCDRKIKEEEGK